MGEGAVPLLGRDEPLGRVRAAVGQAVGGQRSTVLVSGEAGIGKSALVREAVRGVELVAWGTCVDEAGAPAYWPWTRVLDALAGSIGPERAAAAAGDDAGLLAAIGRAFGPTPQTGDASERDRLLLMDAVSRWVARVTTDHGPAVVVVDDLQWADPSSLALLDFLARDPTPASVCVVGCYRYDELSAEVRDRVAHMALAATNVRLTGLDRAAVEALVASVLDPAPPASIDDIHRRAGGHPVFTRELALLAASGDDLARVPAVVHDAIEHRFRRLPEPSHRVLQLAALAGNAFTLDLLTAASEQPEQVVGQALEVASEAGIVVLEPGGACRFSHDLYRETIAASVPREQVAPMHERLGTVLEQRFRQGDDVSAAEIARHLTAAIAIDGAGRAADWALAAAALDRESLAFTEAAAHLRRWRAGVVAAAVPVDARTRIEVLLAEADALARGGAVIDARGLLRMARDVAAHADLPGSLAEVALAVSGLGAQFAARRDDVIAELEHALEAVAGGDPALEARLTATLARELQHSVTSDRPRAGSLSARALELGRSAGDVDALLACLLARHDVLWTPGSAQERAEIAEEIVSLAEKTGSPERRAEGFLLLANARLETGSAAFEPALLSCLEILDRLRQPRHDYTARTRRAALLLLRGELDGAAVEIESAAELGRQLREPDADNVRMSQTLELVRARGDEDELAAFAAAAVAHWTGAPIHAHAVAAGFLARAGDLAGARRHVTTVLDLGTWRADRSYLWSVFVRELSVAAIALEDRSLCADLLQDVAPIAGTCGVNGAVVAFAGCHGHVAGLLARCLGEDASAFLSDAAAVYRRLGAADWLAELDGGNVAGRDQRSMRRTDGQWEVCFDGVRGTLPDVKGVADLAVLLRNADKDVHVLELFGATAQESQSSEMVDRRALAEYRQRLSDLDEEIEQAAAFNDIHRRERAEKERDELVAELQRVTTKRSGARVFANYPAERARKAVTARIRDAIRRIEVTLPPLGAHLDASVTTGMHCRYRQDADVPWDVQP